MWKRWRKTIAIALLLALWGVATGLLLDGKPIWVRSVAGAGTAGLALVGVLVGIWWGGDK